MPSKVTLFLKPVQTEQSKHITLRQTHKHMIICDIYKIQPT